MSLVKIGKKSHRLHLAAPASGVSFKAFLITSIVTLLIFSPIGQILFTAGSNYFPEPGVALMIFLVASTVSDFGAVSRRIFLSKVFLVGLLVVSVAVVFSILNDSDLAMDAYAQARSCIYFIFGYSFVWVAVSYPKHRAAFVKLLEISVLVSILGSILFFTLTQGDAEGKKQYTIPALILLSVFAARSGKPLYILFSTAVIGYSCLTSLYRAFLIYGSILIVLMVIGYVVGARKSGGPSTPRVSEGAFRRLILAALILVGSFAVGIPIFLRWVESDQTRYHQIVYKFEQQYDSFASSSFGEGDDQRLITYKWLEDNWYYCLLPNGFISRKDPVLQSVYGGQTVFISGGSPIYDGAYLFSLISFGLILSLVLTSIYVGMLFRSFRNTRGIVDHTCMAGSVAILVVTSLTMGNLVLVTWQSVYFGASLAFFAGNLKSISYTSAPQRTPRNLAAARTREARES